MHNFGCASYALMHCFALHGNYALCIIHYALNNSCTLIILRDRWSRGGVERLSSDFGLIGFGRATGVGLEKVGECALVVEVQAERNLADVLA